MSASVAASNVPGTGVPTRAVEVGEVVLEIAEAGRGGRPLLLVHGFTGAKEDFGDWLDPLAHAGWWAVAPDLRGHGGSTDVGREDGYSLAAMGGDLVGLLDHLGWGRCAVLGHSMGGMVVQQVVLDHPDRVERLVLMDTHHGAPKGLSPEVVAAGIDLLRAEGLPSLLALLEAFPSEKAPADARVRAERPGYTEWNRSKLDRVDPAMYAAMALELVHRPDRLAELAAIEAPTLVVVGDQDATFLGASRRMADAIAGARLAVIPDAAHSPQFEAPDAWWAELRAFLADG